MITMARPPTPEERSLARRLNFREAHQYRSLGPADARAVPGDWIQQAACKERRTRLFYSVDVADEIAAKKICAECPVIEPCREYARRNREFGVWGGESEVDRARLGRGNPLMTGRAAKAHYTPNGLVG